MFSLGHPSLVVVLRYARLSLIAFWISASMAWAVSAPALNASWLPREERFIRFDHLPRIPSSHSIVSDVQSVNGVNQHNYVAFFEGLYWVMWSDGPGIEDRVGQRVKFATSVDALNWAPGGYITPIAVNSGPDSQVYNTNSSSGLRWIARGFWVRNNQLSHWRHSMRRVPTLARV